MGVSYTRAFEDPNKAVHSNICKDEMAQLRTKYLEEGALRKAVSVVKRLLKFRVLSLPEALKVAELDEDSWYRYMDDFD